MNNNQVTIMNNNQNELRSVSKNELRSTISSEAEINVDFCVRIVSSCLIATLGLIGNSGAVIIGAMLLAPLMLPLRGVALGALEGNVEVIWKSVQTILLGTVIALLLAFGVARLLGLETFEPVSMSEILSRTRPGITDLCIAIIAGAVGGYAAVNPKFSDTAAGTAIAVALMPPICVAGLTLAQGEWTFTKGALLLYLTNICGIAFACTLAFWLAGPFTVNRRAGNTAIYVFCFLLIILFIPLSIRFSQLVETHYIKQEIKFQLEHTDTFREKNLDLTGLEPTWKKDSAEIKIAIQAREKVTKDTVNNFIERVKQGLSAQSIPSDRGSKDVSSSVSEEKKKVNEKVDSALLNSYSLTPSQLRSIQIELNNRLKRFRREYKLTAFLEKVQEIEPEPPTD